MPADNDFSIRFYDGGANDSLRALLRAAFGRWPPATIAVEPSDHLAWKLSSPGAEGTHVVVEAQGEIIGCRFTLARRMMLCGVERSARFGADNAVHPDWQGRGVMTRMREFGWQQLAQHFDLNSGVTDNDVVLKQDLREKRRLFANRIEVLERDALDVPAASAVAGVTVREAAAFDDRIDDFSHEASQPFDIIVVRSREYMNWRYADHRAGRFTIVFAEHDAQLLGYAVLSAFGERGNIADLLVRPERPDILEALLQHCVTRLAASGALRVQVWNPAHHPYRGSLLRNGFTAKRTMQVTLGAYRPDLEDALDVLDDPRAAVHFMGGDTDIV
jgi:GNAT superfamily N-acetyltransferase